MKRMRPSNFASISSATILSLTGLLHAQEGQAKPNEQPDAKPAEVAAKVTLPPQVLIAVDKSPLSKFLIDPRDQALRNALGMLPTRIDELRADLKGQAPEEAILGIQLAIRTIATRWQFGIMFNPTDNSGGALGYGATLEAIFDAEDDALRVGEAVEDAIVKSGNELPKRSKSRKGMRTMLVPGGRLSFGAIAELKSFAVNAGTVPSDTSGIFKAIPESAIQGLAPTIRGTFDLQALTPLAGLAQMGVSQAANGGGVKPPNVTQTLTEMHIIGDNALKGRFEFGYTADASRSRITVENADAIMNQWGTADAKITQNDLNIIPADAISASMSIASTKALSDLLVSMRASGADIDGAIAKIKEETEIDVEKDVIPSLGGVAAIYSAQSTGGGLLGHVALISFKDRPAFIAAHDKFVRFLGAQIKRANRDAARFIHFRHWRQDEIDFYSLTPAGIPIPGELTYAATDRFLIAGLLPQAVVAAARQATGHGDKGLMSREDANLPELKGKNLVSYSFSDTPFLMKQGYNIVALLGQTISNAMRSPGEGTREPGMIVPPLAELQKGARAAVSITYRNEGTLVMESWSDRSMIAGVAGFAGAALDFLPIVGIGAGAAAFKANSDGMLGMLQEPGDALRRIVGTSTSPHTASALLAASTVFDGPLGSMTPSGMLTRYATWELARR
jgi:hypothetical protein